MRLGYNTNGLTGHRWEQGLELMSEIGYRSIALTIDHHCLNPYADNLASELERARHLLAQYGMISCIETGARFLLDPRHKHEPTLVSPLSGQRAIRVDFLKRCVDIAKSLGSDAVSFWAGTVRDDASRQEAYDRLTAGVRELLEYAQPRDVRLAFEPEPGMLVETFDDYQELLSRVEGPGLGLCVDVGHVHCLEPRPIAEYLAEWHDRIYTIHIEDMQRGVHDHLRFGHGTIDFPPVLQALRDLGYEGGVNVELSRHSHMAPEVMIESFEFLNRC
ncbi:MAG: sugar phosphate isomerase/epimerase [Planctomycetes bacterium]|nr:sugar phosphate isomerase/epimerase [Planctomycetota bacterium]